MTTVAPSTRPDFGYRQPPAPRAFVPKTLRIKNLSVETDLIGSVTSVAMNHGIGLTIKPRTDRVCLVTFSRALPYSAVSEIFSILKHD